MVNFSDKIITWQKQHGRHDLPWQNTTDPYAIWVSEIMLQQTQVTAVINYYSKFMLRFPDIATLANATQEEVLQYWSGLGYYSRARNLHSAAQKVVDRHAGNFPKYFDDIVSLPGIGRSTAAAISTFALNKNEPILDGNVKRVFARHFLIGGWPGKANIEKIMWKISEDENPKLDAIAYIQGLMDLGSSICTRTKPKCTVCPINTSCKALKTKCVNTLPTSKPRKVLPEKNTTMLVMMQGNHVMLEKRPPSGIWGGLWSFPEEESNGIKYLIEKKNSELLEPLTHMFTHFKLHIQPKLVRMTAKNEYQINQSNTIWLDLDEAIAAAIPTAVRKILLSLK